MPTRSPSVGAIRSWRSPEETQLVAFAGTHQGARNLGLLKIRGDEMEFRTPKHVTLLGSFDAVDGIDPSAFRGVKRVPWSALEDDTSPLFRATLEAHRATLEALHDFHAQWDGTPGLYAVENEARDKRRAARERHLTVAQGKPSVPELMAVEREVARRMFGGEFEPVPIFWMPGNGRVGGSKMRLGYYKQATQEIFVNRLLASAAGDPRALAHVVYHEALHHALPATVSRGGRVEHHPPAFMARLKLDPYYEACLAWERDTVVPLMRATREARALKAKPRSNPVQPAAALEAEIEQASHGAPARQHGGIGVYL